MPNPLLEQVAERLRARARGQSTYKPPASVYEWALRYRKIDGQPFSLKRFRPLQALYEDEHDRIVVMKPAQRGVSEWAVCLTCFALEFGAEQWVSDGSKAGLNVGLVFPAKADLNDFSKERLSDLKNEGQHLAEMFGTDEFDALGFKKIGQSYLYLRGGYSEAGLRSFPADVVVLDEFDALNNKAIALAKRRMNASLVHRLIEISTPSIPGKGISAEWLASDQRIYQTRCGTCHVWNSYDFFRDVYAQGQPWDEWQKWSQLQVERSIIELRCPTCGFAQDAKARTATGRWMALQPDVERVHGYHIPWWPFEMVDLRNLAHSAVSPDLAEVEEFYHSDLGLPHGAGEGGITAEMLAQLSATLPHGLPKGPWRDTTLGCDVGNPLHFRISSVGQDGGVYVRAMGTLDDWSQLDDLMRRYQVRQAVVDAEPEWHASQEFCERWKGRAVRAFYATGANSLKGVMFNQRGTTDVLVNRVMALDTVYNVVVTAQEHWPSEFTSDENIVKQMSSSLRVRLTDEKTGQQTYDWTHVGPDHFAHACVYDLIARRLLPVMRNQTPAVAGERVAFNDYPVARRMLREAGPSRLSVLR